MDDANTVTIPETGSTVGKQFAVEGETLTNDQRADFAMESIVRFMQKTGSDLEDSLADLLGDLMHWCDRYGMDFADELRRAISHYQAESTNTGPLADARPMAPNDGGNVTDIRQ